MTKLARIVALFLALVAFTVDASAARQTIAVYQNLLVRSQAFTVGGQWSTDSSGTGSTPTVTDNYAIAPDGTTTAARLQMNKGSGTGFSRISQSSSVGYNQNSLYTGSFWLKTNDSSTKSVDLRLGANSTVVTVTGTWQRFSYPTLVGDATGLSCQILLWSSQATDNTADLAVWGAQLVKANWAGPYVATTTAIVNTGSIRNQP